VNGAIRLGRFADADVVADISALLLALFFGGAVFVHLRRSIVDVSNENAAILAVLAGVSVVGCVFVHEAGHVVVARRRGLSVRSIRLFMFGGYSVIDGAAAPRTEFLIAAAGPAASLVLGVLLLSGTYLLGTDSLIGSALWAVGLASLAIGIFNLLPGFPLDGGRVVRSVLVLGGRDRVQATRIVTTVGRGLGVVSMVLGSYLLVTFNPTGLFWLVGGWLLMSSAVTAGKREELSTAFTGITVGDVMVRAEYAVGGDVTISNFLDQLPSGSRVRSVPVQMSGRVVGVIGSEEIDSIAPSRWPSMRVRSLMTRIGPADVIEADSPLEDLFLRPGGPSHRVVVVRAATVVGIIDEVALAGDFGGQ
jgi:Zn-dependent protease